MTSRSSEASVKSKSAARIRADALLAGRLPADRTVKASAAKGLRQARSDDLATALAAANRAHPLFKKKP